MSGDQRIIKKCEIVAQSLELTLFFIDPNGKIVYEHIADYGLNPLYENQKEKYYNPLNFKAEKSYETPIIKKSIYSEKFLIISVFHNGEFQGTALIGPCLSFLLPKNVITNMINDLNAFFYRKETFNYYRKLPIISTEKLKKIGIFVNYLFNTVLLSSKSIILSEMSEKSEMKKSAEKMSLVVSENLQSSLVHSDRLFEKNILYIIKEGRVEDLDNFSFIKEEESARVLSKNSFIRSLKNHIITLITLVSRSAMESGVNEEVAFSLHDSFIQHLEELNRLDEIRSLARDVLYTFARKVKEEKDSRYSRTITICRDYIYKHIYDEISHNDIATHTDLSPKYLSFLFKKEVGIPISQYIQKVKVKEAKRMLAFSKTSISEICSLLNYNDQSYFTKVFKKEVGITPKQYREKNHLIDK